MPLSTSLGLPISAQATPSIEGAGGFFVSDHELFKLLVGNLGWKGTNPPFPTVILIVGTHNRLRCPDRSYQ